MPPVEMLKSTRVPSLFQGGDEFHGHVGCTRGVQAGSLQPPRSSARPCLENRVLAQAIGLRGRGRGGLRAFHCRATALCPLPGRASPSGLADRRGPGPGEIAPFLARAFAPRAVHVRVILFFFFFTAFIFPDAVPRRPRHARPGAAREEGDERDRT